MPIAKSNRHRYPKDWQARRRAVLERAGHCCEGSPLYPECRAKNGEPHPVTGSRVVLTIAHVCPPIEDCRLANLVANCQRCHLSRDVEQHLWNRRQNRLRAEEEAGRKGGQMELLSSGE